MRKPLRLRWGSRLWQRIFTYSLLLVLLSQATPFLLFLLGTEDRETRRDNMAAFFHDIILVNLNGRAQADAKMYLDYFNGLGPQLWFERPDGSVLSGTPVAGLDSASRQRLRSPIPSGKPSVVVYEAEGLAWETGPSEPLGLLVTPVRFREGEAVMCYTYWNGRFPHVQDHFYWGVGALVLVGGALSLWMARHVTLPLRRLRGEVAAVDERDPAGRVTVQGYVEVTDVAEAVNRLTASLSRHIRGMRELMANVSHELRSPLARMTFAVDFIEEGLTEADVARTPADANARRKTALARKHLGLLKEELAVMDQLIGSCLLAGKLDLQQRPADLRPLDLSRLCREAFAGQAGMAEARDIRFLQEVTGDVHILGDALLLRQAVVNLLDNALRYTLPGGRVIVALDFEAEPAMKEAAPAEPETTARRVRLLVANTHPPLSSEALQRIFEPFYRAASGDNADGSGLGLALVQRIIALHGGEVTAQNAECAGESLFQISVTLPAWSETSAEQPTRSPTQDA